MFPNSKIVLFLCTNVFMVNAVVIPRGETKSNAIRILEADPNLINIPDLNTQIVKPTSSDVRGNVPDTTNLAADVIPDGEGRFAVSSVSEDMATTDRLLFSTPMASFLASKAAKDPSTLNWTDDGCTSSPDYPGGFDFLHGCQRHDFGYRNYKAQGRFTDANRLKIDENLKSDLDNECATHTGFARIICNGFAEAYFEAVRAFGGL